MAENFNRRLYVTIIERDAATGAVTPVKQIHGYRDGALRTGLRVSFQITKSLDGIADAATIRIYNMSPESRALLAQRSIFYARATPRTIQISGGYEGNIGALFNGTIVKVTNERKAPDWITTIEGSAALDLVLTNVIDRSYGSHGGVNGREVLENLLGSGAGLGKPKYGTEALAKLNGTTHNELVLSGRLMDVIKRMMTGLDMVMYIGIDGVSVVKRGEPITTDALHVSEVTGLLGAPSVEDTGAKFRTLLDYRLTPGQLVYLESETLAASTPGLNQYLTTWTIQLSGDTHSDDWFSDVHGLFYPLLSALDISQSILSLPPMAPEDY